MADDCLPSARPMFCCWRHVSTQMYQQCPQIKRLEAVCKATIANEMQRTLLLDVHRHWIHYIRRILIRTQSTWLKFEMGRWGRHCAPNLLDPATHSNTRPGGSLGRADDDDAADSVSAADNEIHCCVGHSSIVFCFWEIRHGFCFHSRRSARIRNTLSLSSFLPAAWWCGMLAIFFFSHVSPPFFPAKNPSNFVIRRNIPAGSGWEKSCRFGSRFHLLDHMTMRMFTRHFQPILDNPRKWIQIQLQSEHWSAFRKPPKSWQILFGDCSLRRKQITIRFQLDDLVTCFNFLIFFFFKFKIAEKTDPDQDNKLIGWPSKQD